MMSHLRYAPLPLGLLLALLTACGAAPPPPPAASDPGPLLPYDALETRAVWRQRVTAIWPDGTQSFDAALQRTDDALSLIGLSPLGPPGFVIRHDAAGVHFTNHTDRTLPFAPTYMLADVQKVHYPWLPPGATDGNRAGYAITETHADGRLTRRVFRHPERPTITVTYDGDTATLRNEGLGYTLRVETVEVIPIEPSEPHE